MDVAVVIAEPRRNPPPGRGQGVNGIGEIDEAPRPSGIGRDGAQIESSMFEYPAQETALLAVLRPMIEKGSGLGGDDPLRFQKRPQRGIERLLMEDRGGADRIGRIDEDDVETVLGRADEFVAVGDHQNGPRISEVPAQPGVEFFADVDDLSIDLAQHRLAHGVAQDLAQRAPVAAPDDKDVLGRGMKGQGGMDEHFVIEEFVLVRRLDEAVQQKDPAEGLVADKLDSLELRSAPVEGLVDREEDAVRRALVLAGFLHEVLLGDGCHSAGPNRARGARMSLIKQSGIIYEIPAGT
jgi:hypothetical protein